MGQKVNPHGLRVGVIKNWDSRWFVSAKEMGDTIVSDHKIREYVKTKLQGAGVPKVEIERDSARVRGFIQCAKPGVVIGFHGAEIEKLRAELEKMVGRPVVVNVIEIKNPDINAQLVAVAYANDNTIYVDSVDAYDIYAALTVTCAHDYDDCEDTTCNICGETRVAPGHTYGDYVSNGDAKCGVDGTKTRTCSVCGKKDTVADTGSALEHDWTDWEVVKEPTNNKEGLEQRTCKLCGEIETRPIPTKDNDWVWIVVGSVVVLAAAAGVVYYRKKKVAPEPEKK